MTVANPSTGGYVQTNFACGYYPEFIGNYVSGSPVHVGANYMGYYDEGCINVINTSISTNTDVALANGWETANGMAVNSNTGTAYAVGSWSLFTQGYNYVYTFSGTTQGTTLTLSSNAEGPWAQPTTQPTKMSSS